MKKLVESKTKVRFQDCDPFNHLNNRSYLDYFMNHREDMLLETYDLDIYKMARTIGKSWVVASNQIAYLKPAFLMETVVMQSQLIYFDKSSLKVEMRMYNADKSKLKAVLWSTFVHFNLLNQKREIHDDELMQFFPEILNPTEVKTFEERMMQIRSKMQTTVSN